MTSVSTHCHVQVKYLYYAKFSTCDYPIC